MQTDLEESLPEQEVSIGGPPFHVNLSALDACHPIHYSRRLLIFKCADQLQWQRQTDAMALALKALSERCNIIGGVTASLPPLQTIPNRPEWRTIISGEGGLEYIMRDRRATMASFKELEAANFPADMFPYDQLMPVPEDLTIDDRFAACKVQSSAITGGHILTFAISHSVADGTGTDELMRLLAEYTKRAQTGTREPLLIEARTSSAAAPLGLDRSLMRSVTSDLPFQIADHPAYRWREESSGDIPPHPFESHVPEIPVLLRLSPAGHAKLKAAATMADGPRISTHDVICALMWRSALRIRSGRSDAARAVSPETNTHLFMPTDARKHLPQLPSPYIGNAVYQLAASLSFGALLSTGGLAQAAAAVRTALNAITPAIVTSYLAEINRVDTPRALDWKFLAPHACVTGLAMGTDLGSGEAIYGADWGPQFGPVESFRWVSEEGNNCVMPRCKDGAVEIVLSVAPHEVESLKGKECFGPYLGT